MRSSAIVLASCLVACCTSSTSGAPQTTSAADVDHEPDAATVRAARRALASEVESLAALDGTRTAVAVAIDVSSGAVLATAGRVEGHDDPELAFTTPFPHGSIAKTFTVATALETGAVEQGDRFDAEPRVVGGREIRDHVARTGTMSLEDVIAFSSNVGASHVYERLGRERLIDGLAALGLGARVEALAPIDEARAEGIAIGTVLTATPIEIAGAFTAIARDGMYRAPFRLGEAPPPEHFAMRAEVARAAMRLLEQAVARDDGTGTRARVPGFRVAGKTGTAMIGEERRFGCFVGAIPAESPRFVILVGVETTDSGYSGGTLAAPAFARIATALVATPSE